MMVNLSMVFDRPTGISNYATNLLPCLQPLNPTWLSAKPFDSEARWYPIPSNMSPAAGSIGHVRRLLWTQFAVPRIAKQLNSQLFFSPVPEAPLASNCRSVVVVHDLIPLRYPRYRSPLYYYFRFYIPRVVQQAKHVICNSDATARDVVDWYGVASSKVTAIPLAVDRDRFYPRECAHDGSSDRYFLYLGRHDPHKNLLRTLRAFAAVRQHHAVEFWLAGPVDGRFTPQLHQLTDELGIAQSVKFLDYVPEDRLLRLLDRALGFVFPSLWEGFGLPVLEAMACGTPVITSNVASLPEVAGDAALCVDPLSVEALTDAMTRLLVDDRLRGELRQAGIARASQFSWERTGQATAAILRRFI